MNGGESESGSTMPVAGKSLMPKSWYGSTANSIDGEHREQVGGREMPAKTIVVRMLSIFVCCRNAETIPSRTPRIEADEQRGAHEQDRVREARA